MIRHPVVDMTGDRSKFRAVKKPMDRGAWQATVHGVARVGHDLVTQQAPPPNAGLQGDLTSPS